MSNPTDPDVDPRAYFDQLLPQIAQLLYTSITLGDGSDSLSVTLEFDELQRVSAYENLLVNGLPHMLTPELSEALNKLSSQLGQLPVQYHLAGLVITVEPGGHFKTIPTYRKN